MVFRAEDIIKFKEKWKKKKFKNTRKLKEDNFATITKFLKSCQDYIDKNTYDIFLSHELPEFTKTNYVVNYKICIDLGFKLCKDYIDKI